MTRYALILVCSAALGLASQRAGLSLPTMYVVIVAVWLLAVIP